MTSLKCWFVLGALAFCTTGCSQLMGPSLNGPIREHKDPQSDREYLLYTPTGYDAAKSWPLIIVCEGGGLDSPSRQLTHWAGYADSHGFLVVAPTIKARVEGWGTKPEERNQQLREDEEHILSVVQHVRAGHTVSEDRVFLHGWSAGAATVLYTGLRHPEVFRAISLAQPTFKAGGVPIPETAIDHYQPVQLLFQRSNMLTGKQGKECANWLRSKGVALRDELIGKVEPKDVQKFVSFFEDVIRKTAWVRVEQVSTGSKNPLEVRFKVVALQTPQKYGWDFGDGDQSPVAEPIHAYKLAGVYRVSVLLEGLPGGPHRRTIEVRVPK